MNSFLWVRIGGTLGFVFGSATVTGTSLDIAANVVAGAPIAAAVPPTRSAVA